MIMRRNLVKNLKGFYQQTGGLHRFYSQALVDANQSEISLKEDPFSLVEDEVSQIGNFVREQVAKAAELMIPDPNLALGATNYYFKRFPVEKFRLTVPLLMASALNAPISDNLRARQHCIVKNTEFIDVASLFQDGLLLDADKLRGFRSIYPLNSDQIRGIESLNCVMREQYSVMAGNYLVINAHNEVEALNNTDVHSLFSEVVKHSFSRALHRQQLPGYYDSLNHCLSTTDFKTASFISNSCKAIAILAGQNADVSMLAYEYGRNLGLAYELTNDARDMNNLLRKGSVTFNILLNAPMTFAREEFPELGKVIAELDYDYYCDYPSSIAVMIEALEYVKASKGIERTIELAKEYSNRAKEIIGELPNSDDVSVLMHRKALIDLSDWAIKRMNCYRRIRLLWSEMNYLKLEMNSV